MRKPPTLLTAAIVLAGMVAIQPTAHAGSLKSWDKTTSGTARWKSLANFGNAAVLDKQTGLVWETTPTTLTLSYENAGTYCANRVVGGQTGFRLPTIGELASLSDPSQSPPLPVGHPFTINPFGDYWTSTLVLIPPSSQYYNFWQMAGLSHFSLAIPTTGRIPWCVRGPGGN